jgi:D-sedoheptulose 7-phosphate isomerase
MEDNMLASLDGYINNIINAKQNLQKNVLPSIIQSAEAMAKCLLNESKLITYGNGIASGVSHYFTSLMVTTAKYDKPALPVISLCSGITEIFSMANHSDYKSVFSRQVQAIGKEKDILVIFSIYGNEVEIIESIKSAYNKGISVILVTNNDNAEAKKYMSAEDIIIVAQADNLGISYEIQVTIASCISQIVDSLLFNI